MEQSTFKPFYEVAAEITLEALAKSEGSYIENPQAVTQFYTAVYECIVDCVHRHKEEELSMGMNMQNMNEN